MSEPINAPLMGLVEYIRLRFRDRVPLIPTRLQPAIRLFAELEQASEKPLRELVTQPPAKLRLVGFHTLLRNGFAPDDADWPGISRVYMAIVSRLSVAERMQLEQEVASVLQADLNEVSS